MSSIPVLNASLAAKRVKKRECQEHTRNVGTFRFLVALVAQARKN